VGSCLHTPAGMKKSSASIVCAILLGGCADYEDDGLAEDLAVGETESEDEQAAMGEPVEDPDEPDSDLDPLDPELVGTNGIEASNSDPHLHWVLHAKMGQAKFIGVDPATGVATTVNSSSNYGTTWLPIGIAGNKVLWQHQTNGAIIIWTINPTTGAYVTSKSHSVPTGWVAKGITLDQEGQCPQAAESDRSYTILFQRPTTWFSPSPAIWHLDQNLDHVLTEYLPTSYSSTSDLRDFRYTVQGYAALIYKNPFAFGGHGDNVIDWYGRTSSGALERLRTDTYSATGGNVSCTAHKAGVPCFVDMNDTAPGAGFELTSMVTTWQASGGTSPRSYLLWSKGDGTATNLRLGYIDGKLKSPAAPITTTNAGFTSVSETGDSPGFCPIVPPPAEPFSSFSIPVLDPQDCEFCS